MGRRVTVWLVGIVLAMLVGLGIHFAQDVPAPGSSSWSNSPTVLLTAAQEPAPPPPVRVEKDVRIRVNPDDDDDESPAMGKRFLFTERFGLFRPRLGVQLEDLTAEKARELKAPGEYGVLVRGVTENTAAAKAGIAKDDVIVEFAGEKVRSAAQLRRLVEETPPGRNVTLQVIRAGQAKTLSATMEEARESSLRPHAAPLPELPEPPDVPDFFNFEIPPPGVMVYKPGVSLGISGDELTRQLADYFGVKQGKGVLVREVVVGSAAEKAGLKAGDVVVKVNDTEVGSVGQLRRALPKVSGEKQKVTLTIVRDRREQTIGVELEAPLPPKPRQFAHAPAGLDSVAWSDWATCLREATARFQRQFSQLQQAWKDNARRLREN